MSEEIQNPIDKNEIILSQSKEICRLHENLKQAKIQLTELNTLVDQMEPYIFFRDEDRKLYMEKREQANKLIEDFKGRHFSSGMYRNMVRITKVEDETVSFCLPGWDHKVEVTIRKDQLPQDLLPHLEVGYRFHAKAPGNVDIAEQIFLEDIEFKPKEKINDNIITAKTKMK